MTITLPPPSTQVYRLDKYTYLKYLFNLMEFHWFDKMFERDCITEFLPTRIPSIAPTQLIIRVNFVYKNAVCIKI